MRSGTSRSAPAMQPEPGLAAKDSSETVGRPSFERLYDEHFAFVWRVVRRLGVPPARVDDAVQDVFMVVLRKLDSFDGRAPRAWLTAIARRVASESRRAARRDSLSDEAVSITVRQLVQEKYGKGETGALEAAELLHSLMDTLDTDKREVFVLAELEQMSIPEVSEVLGINQNTAYSRLRAARQTLHAAYARLVAREDWMRQ